MMLADLQPRLVRLMGNEPSRITSKGGVRVGQRFGLWLVEAYSHYDESRKATKWRCICDCGTKRAVAAAGLLSGRSQSCGCLGKVNREKGWREYLKRRRRPFHRKAA